MASSLKSYINCPVLPHYLVTIWLLYSLVKKMTMYQWIKANTGAVFCAVSLDEGKSATENTVTVCVLLR